MQTLGFLLGASFASGLNLYATVAALGLLQRFDVIQLPASLQILSHPLVLGIAILLYTIEFVADKIPYVDNVWDVLHTFIRPPAAGVLAYAAMAGVPDHWRVAAALLAGSVALASHGTKASTRAAVNTSPEPASNWLLSLGEDGIAVSLTWLAATHPVLTLFLVLLLAVLCALVVVKLFSFLGRIFRRAFGRGHSGRAPMNGSDHTHRRQSMRRLVTVLLVSSLLLSGAYPAPKEYDVIIRNGMICDGSGKPPVRGDVAINGDTIVAVGKLGQARGKTEIDAKGMAVAPGFINMLSWATESLIVDGRSLSDIRQGITLEVFGEGWSMGPLNEEMKKEAAAQQGDIKYDIQWTTLAEYLDYLVQKGVAPNVASFVGATTVRIHEIGFADRPPTAEELARMKALVRQAMQDGALGVGSSLIYAPAFYAKTDELIELCKVAAEYDGMYISHMRSEGGQLLPALDELIRISREAKLPAEIYHLKAAGKPNWGKLDEVIRKVEAARKQGLRITADMYTYTAGATGLDASMPPWVQEGGLKKWIERLNDPTIRERVKQEMTTPTDRWENFFLGADPEGILLSEFKNDKLKPLTGKTLAEVAKMRGTSPAETAMDLVIEDESRVGAIYFLMSEDNVRRQIKLPWVSFGSDAASQAPEGVFLKSHPHPRTYGNVARLLGRYVRDEKLIPLEEAVRRLTSLPASNLKIKNRGLLKKGYVADVVVFDPARIQDHATFETPHQLATGVVHVFVNGTQVLRDGEHTGATPGRVVRGPGWRQAK